MMISRVVPALIALALLLVSCSQPAADAPAGSQVVAELADYRITVAVPSVKAGKIKIGVRNLASMEHSFQVLKTDLAPDKLPVDGASAKANEDGKVGELKSIPPGSPPRLRSTSRLGNTSLSATSRGITSSGCAPAS